MYVCFWLGLRSMRLFHGFRLYINEFYWELSFSLSLSPDKNSLVNSWDFNEGTNGTKQNELSKCKCSYFFWLQVIDVHTSVSFTLCPINESRSLRHVLYLKIINSVWLQHRRVILQISIITIFPFHVSAKIQFDLHSKFCLTDVGFATSKQRHFPITGINEDNKVQLPHCTCW